jgi:hypothetical protein
MDDYDLLQRLQGYGNHRETSNNGVSYGNFADKSQAAARREKEATVIADKAIAKFTKKFIAADGSLIEGGEEPYVIYQDLIKPKMHPTKKCWNDFRKHCIAATPGVKLTRVGVGKKRSITLTIDRRDKAVKAAAARKEKKRKKEEEEEQEGEEAQPQVVADEAAADSIPPPIKKKKKRKTKA